MLKLLQKAFDRKMTFTVGTSLTTGEGRHGPWLGADWWGGLELLSGIQSGYSLSAVIHGEGISLMCLSFVPEGFMCAGLRRWATRGRQFWLHYDAEGSPSGRKGSVSWFVPGRVRGEYLPHGVGALPLVRSRTEYHGNRVVAGFPGHWMSMGDIHPIPSPPQSK